MLAELPSGQALKSSELSNRMGVSRNYLQKIGKKLGNAGLVSSEATKYGGYTLTKSVDEITLLDLYTAVEANDSFLSGVDFSILHRMFLTKEIVTERGMVLRNILSLAEQEFKNILAAHTIGEIVPRDSSGKILTLDWKKIIADSQLE